MKRIIYIAHSYSNNPEHNLAEVRRIYQSVSAMNVIPFCPWYITVLALDENTDRALGMGHNKIYFERKAMDEVWLCGDHISKGMQQEVEWAYQYGIVVIDKINKI